MTHDSLIFKTRKEVIIDTAKKAISYIKNGPTTEDGLKPYYLYRLNNKNELKEYLIGYRLIITDYKIAREEYSMVKDEQLITRSIRQIENEINGEEIKYNHTSVHILAEKVDGEWETYLKKGINVTNTTLSISTMEGNPYLDSVWLQTEDKEYAIKLILLAKIKAINNQLKVLDALKEKEDILNKLYNQAIKEKENGSK